MRVISEFAISLDWNLLNQIGLNLNSERGLYTFVYYQINNENLKNEVKNAERREEIIKQVQQENQSKSSIYSEGISQFFFCNKKKVVDKLMSLGRQRLALMLDSLTQPGRRIDRSQTFSDHPHRPVSFVKIKNSSNILS